ncbi:SulP family inorganic anion transporter [Gilvimarinus sp. DZF01]|uniref:SulP family inorganic anion transporter n=1 Tax=Gilvimarinus sp. DZF01 TaxID=3461371 RepID=UPI0040464CF1
MKTDLAAGSVGGIAAIPDGLAAAVMAGVNPIHGIYASIVGRIAGGLSTSSALMCVTTTGAISITIADAMGGIPEERQAGALALLVLIAGLVQLAMGVLRLGFLIRFVSNTVTTGFLAGVAVNIVLSQLGELAGYQSSAASQLARIYDLATHLGQIQPQTLLVGSLTIVVVVALQHTRLASLAMMLGLALAALATHLLGLEGVRLVADAYAIPASLPLPILPDLAFLPDVTLTAVAVGIVGLLQGAGISQRYPNPNGRYPDISVDFRGQGVANLACALLRGLPVGGSIGQTALLVDAGARSRWATLISGVVTALSILLLAPLVEALPMAAVAGLLVVVGARAVPVEQIRVIWKSGWINAAVMALTFAGTLIVPMEQAVVLGVLVTFVLQIGRAANRLELLQLIPRDYGLFEERPAPNRLASRSITMLLPNGSLFFAGSRVLEAQLPDPEDSELPVVMLLLRGRKEVGSTFIGVVDRYAEKLQARGGKLVLVGASDRVLDQLRRTGVLVRLHRENVYPATNLVAEALRNAYADAEDWLAAHEPRDKDTKPASSDGQSPNNETPGS